MPAAAPCRQWGLPARVCIGNTQVDIDHGFTLMERGESIRSVVAY
jgi:hypothetical protein